MMLISDLFSIKLIKSDDNFFLNAINFNEKFWKMKI